MCYYLSIQFQGQRVNLLFDIIRRVTLILSLLLRAFPRLECLRATHPPCFDYSQYLVTSTNYVITVFENFKQMCFLVFGRLSAETGFLWLYSVRQDRCRVISFDALFCRITDSVAKQTAASCHFQFSQHFIYRHLKVIHPLLLVNKIFHRIQSNTTPQCNLGY